MPSETVFSMRSKLVNEMFVGSLNWRDAAMITPPWPVNINARKGN